MVISRFMRRLLLTAALCLPLPMVPTNPPAATSASKTVVVEANSLAFWGKIAAIIGGVAFFPKVYSLLPKAKETPKSSQSNGGNIFGKAVYSVWNFAANTAYWYWNAARNIGLGAYNTPTYLKSSLDSSLGWDKTGKRSNQATALANYKAAKPNYSSKDMLPLYQAIMIGDVDAVQAWLDASAGFYAYHFNDGPKGITEMTGLMLAATFAYPAITDLFLKYRKNINYQDKNLRSALMHATIIPDEVLKKYNNAPTQAQLNAMIQQGRNVAGMKSKEMMRKEQEVNRAHIVADLISHSANIALVDKDGRNALHHAAANNLYDALKEVASAMEDGNFDLNAIDKDKKTALVYAVQKCAVNSVRLLVQTYNAAINAESNDNSNALRLSISMLQPYVQHMDKVKEEIRHANAQMNDEQITQRAIDMFEQNDPQFLARYVAILNIYRILQKAVDDSAPSQFTDISYNVSEQDQGWVQSLGDTPEDYGFSQFDSAPEVAPVEPQQQQVQAPIQQLSANPAQATAGRRRRPTVRAVQNTPSAANASQQTASVSQAAPYRRVRVPDVKAAKGYVLVYKNREEYEAYKTSEHAAGKTEKWDHSDGTASFLTPEELAKKRTEKRQSNGLRSPQPGEEQEGN